MSSQDEIPAGKVETPTAAGPTAPARITAALIVLVIFLLPAAGFVWLRTVSRQAAEDAVIAHAANMLVRYSARTRGQWPDSWDDLEEDFEPADANFGTPSLAVMKQAVAIDFNADLSDLPAPDDEAPPPRLLWLRGRPDSPEVEQTNRRLVQSLRTRRGG